MKCKIAPILFFLLAFTLQSFTNLSGNNSDELITERVIYDFKINDIHGENIDLELFKGKKILIVNTASGCGLANDQFKALEEVYTKYKNSNLVILAFPSNDFRNCEVASNDEIKEIYKKKFNVSFPIMGKISVRGKNKDKLYKFLTDKKRNGVHSCGVLWNFQKFLINEEGVIEKIISPKVKATDKEVVDWITKK